MLTMERFQHLPVGSVGTGFWHVPPPKPGGQRQKKPFGNKSVSVQVPPFWQGFGVQGAEQQSLIKILSIY